MLLGNIAYNNNDSNWYRATIWYKRTLDSWGGHDCFKFPECSHFCNWTCKFWGCQMLCLLNVPRNISSWGFEASKPGQCPHPVLCGSHCLAREPSSGGWQKMLPRLLGELWHGLRQGLWQKRTTWHCPAEVPMFHPSEWTVPRVCHDG